jgi:hypothetical protein
MNVLNPKLIGSLVLGQSLVDRPHPGQLAGSANGVGDKRKKGHPVAAIVFSVRCENGSNRLK